LKRKRKSFLFFPLFPSPEKIRSRTGGRKRPPARRLDWLQAAGVASPEKSSQEKPPPYIRQKRKPEHGQQEKQKSRMKSRKRKSDWISGTEKPPQEDGEKESRSHKKARPG
jgi:hypothetical protein